jgi:hypothetical protein
MIGEGSSNAKARPDQEDRRGCTSILLIRFHRCVGDVELFRARCDLSALVEDWVEERGRLMVASWSARTSSRRTSESDMRRCESWGSRISMNLEGVSRIVA